MSCSADKFARVWVFWLFLLLCLPFSLEARARPKEVGVEHLLGCSHLRFLTPLIGAQNDSSHFGSRPFWIEPPRCIRTFCPIVRDTPYISLSPLSLLSFFPFTTQFPLLLSSLRFDMRISRRLSVSGRNRDSHLLGSLPRFPV